MARTIDALRRRLEARVVAVTAGEIVDALADRGWYVFYDEGVPDRHEIGVEFLGDGTGVIRAASDLGSPDRLGHRTMALIRALERVMNLEEGSTR